jgi:polyhydroxybutyrate depolymerase
MLAAAAAVAAVVAPAAWVATAAPGALRAAAISTPTRPGQLGRLVSVRVHGHIRHYRVFVPRHAPRGPLPLLVALHPLNGTATRFERTSGLDAGAEAHGVVVAYPDGLGRSWDAGTCCGYAVRHKVSDVDFVLRVVADAERRLPIDTHRVAVTGFSNGALMSYRLACERPDVFSAAVPVAGDVVVPRCAPRAPVALLHVHGARDPLIPLAGLASSALDPAGFPPAAGSVERIATADGCSGAGVTSSPGIVLWTATGCRPGSLVEFVTVATLGHHYPSGPADARRYGLDMSGLTWQFLESVWSA